ncbi:class I SAM-dependent DNA methyltransferase [Afipia clevelandensis]|uniref:site-specific DNA-methyltransferase (adenine-specific) n=1 Tax=Afipia clevelandensis ATCC 49720 TaxID=883079 RepID=K8P1R0_9BRAD|nr:DNA methyltransferase [Afipia clevelandensis]EKS35381.1 hypothetical protein HMPREF9696_02653 [Afipia clevelandensis ATCC 49720]
MNAVEIEEAVSDLAGQPFDPGEFPYAFLTAFGNKDTTIKRLRTGNTNASDVPAGVLQRNHIHIAVCPDGMVSKTIVALRESPKTASAKAKFVLATDGVSLEAEDLIGGEAIACVYKDFAKHFGFFLPLAGISTVKEIKNNPFDIKATGRLNKLYVELLKDNPDWAKDAKRPALNQFIARLIFCFFAEDTGIFRSKQFTKTIEQMSDSQSGNTHEILCELFRAMDLKSEDREAAKIKSWANDFPYVNGGMFAGGAECPKFSRIARSYLLAVGNLEWDKINPDIFGSMIQAVADDGERGELGMHYTSVPNILKVLNPLFLDDLREHLQSTDDNVRKLRNLRKRLSTIRVFDPACGSGNFLVIAYKEMRAIEHVIVRRTGDDPKSWIKLDNFFGIEIKNFAVEIARLALLIAEFQCDVQYISQQEARAMVLPLHRTGQIRSSNALQLNWLEVCPPPKSTVLAEHDLAGPTGRLALDENSLTESQSIETYVCGNPPYKGSQWQTKDQKNDLVLAFKHYDVSTGALDYVSGWFIKACDYLRAMPSGAAAFVATNSINQGRQVALLWRPILEAGLEINFAHRSFQWSNLAKNKAGVTVSVIGFGKVSQKHKLVVTDDVSQKVSNISPYLVSGPNIFVESRNSTLSAVPSMTFGNMPNDDGFLLLDGDDARRAASGNQDRSRFIRPIYGSQEFIQGVERRCIWVRDEDYEIAKKDEWLRSRFDGVAAARKASTRETTRVLANSPYRFGEVRQTGEEVIIAVPGISSENRNYLPCGLLPPGTIVSNKIYALLDAPLWTLALIASRIHWVWIATVCVRLRTDFSYSNTLGWNTFPVPPLTEHNKTDLARSAQNILLCRESHFPASIAELYEAGAMPDDLKRAHDQNDEEIERIYIGRRFRNDTERLEKLFELYAKMSSEKPQPKKKAKRAA